jgi:hypothetical protein
MKTSAIRMIVVFSALLPLLAGCDESLPPRDATLPTLRGECSIPDTFVVLHGSEVSGAKGAFESVVVNMFDEVLQDTAFIQVDYTVRLEQYPDSIATLRAGRGDVLTLSAMTGQIVTLRPGVPFKVQKIWNHATDNGTPFWMMATLHKKLNSRGETYYDSDPVPLMVTCTIRTFKHVPEIPFGPVRIAVQYSVFDVTLPTTD